MEKIFFRVDASDQIGYGHLVRCVSIAASLSKYEVHFISTEPIGDFLESQSTQKISFRKIENSNDFFNLVSTNDTVIIDGYNFSSDYHLSIRKSGAKIIAIDDLAEQEFIADIIINPTPLIKASDYQSVLHTQFLIGLNYALLRPSFLDLAVYSSVEKESDSLFICFGGSDPLNKTKSALEATIGSNAFEKIHVVLGPGYNHFESIEKLIDNDTRVEYQRDLNEEKMVQLMSRSEYAILPSSGILLEGLAAKMKIISGFYIENQKHVYQHHLELGSFVDANNFSIEDIQNALKIVKSHQPQSDLIDGNSIKRITKSIDLLVKEQFCTFQKAEVQHTKKTFTWANDPIIRQFAFNKGAIPWVDHQSWFSSKVNAPDCYYGILKYNDDFVGSIRFDIKDKIALISYLVAPEWHGQGFGTLLIKFGLQGLADEFNSVQISEVHGFVFPSNIASTKTFERFGFKSQAEKDVLLFSKKFSIHV
ncbi:MAG: UDP-2,4-diacetamido-2,4,6-trideoxy-beta-L-altropyranose hydrolase [Crocinitomicaceae bacterium]|jgi:UDP-2,4-diacetamido-2,4,6-trideoxy-beta-L-altropyranose hydrolase